MMTLYIAYFLSLGTSDFVLTRPKLSIEISEVAHKNEWMTEMCSDLSQWLVNFTPGSGGFFVLHGKLMIGLMIFQPSNNIKSVIWHPMSCFFKYLGQIITITIPNETL